MVYLTILWHLLSAIALLTLTIRLIGIKHIKNMDVTTFIYFCVAGNLYAGAAVAPDLTGYLQNMFCVGVLSIMIAVFNKILDRKNRNELIQEIFGEEDVDA